RRCVLDAERKGQWDRVRVEGSVRLEIDDGRQDLKSVCVEYFAAADGPFSRGPRGSELGRECPGGASAPAHGHYVGMVGPSFPLGLGRIRNGPANSRPKAAGPRRRSRKIARAATSE